MADSEPTDDTTTDEGAERELRCDFCGDPTPKVQRVALDRDYDRLQQRHKVLYACVKCSERKDRQRLGLERN